MNFLIFNTRLILMMLLIRWWLVVIVVIRVVIVISIIYFLLISWWLLLIKSCFSWLLLCTNTSPIHYWEFGLIQRVLYCDTFLGIQLRTLNTKATLEFVRVLRKVKDHCYLVLHLWRDTSLCHHLLLFRDLSSLLHSVHDLIIAFHLSYFGLTFDNRGNLVWIIDLRSECKVFYVFLIFVVSWSFALVLTILTLSSSLIQIKTLVSRSFLLSSALILQCRWFEGACFVFLLLILLSLLFDPLLIVLLDRLH